MLIPSSQIKQQIYKDFSKKYKAFGGFIDSGELWDKCIDAIEDPVFLGHIIFCNDIHQIPPVHTFLRAKNITANLSELEKRSIGAFWGFVFKFVFGYQNQKSATTKMNTVRTATYFFDTVKKIKIVQ